MAITLHSSMHFLPRHALESPLKASSTSTKNTGSNIFQFVSTSTRNYGSHGILSVRRSSCFLEDPTSLKVCKLTPPHLSQFVDNMWSSCFSLPRGLGWRDAKWNARHIHLLSGHVRAASTCQGSHEEPTPEDEDAEVGLEEALPSDGLREEPMDSTQVSGSGGDLDWRAFRARLVQLEQVGTKPPTA